MNEPSSSLPSLRLDGRRALVTGASSGLGERFARVLAAAGAHVLITARRTDRLKALAAEIRASGGTVTARAMDVTDVTAIRGTIADAERDIGPLHILVNNAGISATHRFVEVEPEAFDAITGTNLRGTFFVAQAVTRHMLAHGIAGRIVNIASTVGMKPISRLSAYGLSKAGLIHLTRSMALELARSGINVNAICPGYIRTEINDAYFDSEAGRHLIERLPRRRVGTADELDGLLLLLCSDASPSINGAIIAADDGMAAG